MNLDVRAGYVIHLGDPDDRAAALPAAAGGGPVIDGEAEEVVDLEERDAPGRDC